MAVSMDTRRKQDAVATGDARREALRTWEQILACTAACERMVRKRLRERFATTLPRFELLAQLDAAPAGLRMGEVSRRMMVTGGNVTGIVAQLLDDGLVERSVDSVDRRASVVRLTDRGRDLYRAMADEHETWIIEFVEGLSEAGQPRLERLLGVLQASANAARAEGSTSTPVPRAALRLAEIGSRP